MSCRMKRNFIRARLVERRKTLGLTQEQIADALEINPRTVMRWENGQSEPKLTIQQVATLCTLYRCSIDELAAMFPRELVGGENTREN